MTTLFYLGSDANGRLMSGSGVQFSFNVLTINTHKGFTAFNRRFILPELREAVRTVGADIVCLQEVMGEHEAH